MQSVPDSCSTTPIFDFDPDEVETDSSTSTIKALLIEINQELPPGLATGKAVTLASLKTALNFLGQFTGKKYTRTTESLPLSFLKTVKLLYVRSRDGSDHICKYLELPDANKNKPTFEFRLTGRAARNENKILAVLEILAQLERGIPEEKRRQIKLHLPPPAHLLDYIEKENSEILAPDTLLSQGSEQSKTDAIRALAKQIRTFPVFLFSSTPVNEALYIRILSLPFIHFVGAYAQIEELAAIKVRPKADDMAMREIGRSLGQGDIEPYFQHCLSIESFPDFFTANVTALTKIVSAVTSLPIQKRDLEGKIDYVQKVLHLHVFHQHKRQPLDAKLLALADAVAALCAVAHQQKAKTPLSASFQGKSTKNSDKKHNLLKQLDSELSIDDLYEEDYVPHGINQLLHSRMSQFHAYLSGYEERYFALREFTLSRLFAYAACLHHTDVKLTAMAVSALNRFCALHAARCGHTANLDGIIRASNPSA